MGFADIGLKMTDVRANQGAEALPKARYVLRVERYTEGETSAEAKTPNTLCYKVGLKVEAGDWAGKWVWDTITMGGDRFNDNVGRLRALFEACGITEDDMMVKGFDPNTEWGAENLVGKVVKAEVYTSKPSADFPNPSNGVTSYHEHEFTDADLT